MFIAKQYSCKIYSRYKEDNMWNAVELVGFNFGELNLNIAVKELADRIKITDFSNRKKIPVPDAMYKRLIKCKKMMESSKRNVIYKLVFILFHKNGLSYRAFLRTLKVNMKEGYCKYYINYKYLTYIVKTTLDLIKILDPNILQILYNHSATFLPVSNNVTYKFIPLRKNIIKNEVYAYNNNKKAAAIQNPYLQYRIKKLNNELNKLD